MSAVANPTLAQQQRALFDRFVSTGDTLDRTDVEQVLELHDPGRPTSYVRQVLQWDAAQQRLVADIQMTASAFDATRKPDFAPGQWERLIAGQHKLRVRSIGIYQLVRMM